MEEIDSNARRAYRFGEFELDLDAHLLRLHGRPVKLERRPFQLLAMLVARHGRLVTREELVASLWPSKVVIDFDTGLNTLVRKVRQALGDAPETPTFIETRAGLGYRFIAPVEEIGPAAPDGADKPGPGQLPVAADDSGRRRTGIALAVAALAAAAAIAWAVWSGVLHRTRDVSIAVLPFENLTEDEGLGYLAAGLAEDTSASLAQLDLENLRLVGRATAGAFARSEKSLAEMGRELGVDFVVASSLRSEREKLRVTSRLMRVTDYEEVWTGTFDREMTSTLGLQRELSVAIAEQVRLKLSPEHNAAISRRQTSNPRAYDLYLRGRYAWSRVSPLGNRNALEYFQRAIDEDADYGLAWGGMLQVLSTAPITGEVEPASVAGRARDAARRAVESGADLAEVQFSIGYYHFFLDWDWAASEAAFRRAIELDPNSAIAHLMLGHVLTQRGDYTEGREMARRARELDPFFSHTFALSATMAWEARDFAAAADFARQAVAINPEGWVGHLNLGMALAGLGDHEGALAAYERALRASGNNFKSRAARALLLGKMGRADEAREQLAELLAIAREQYVPPYTVALVLVGLGEREQALDWLERALEVRDIHLVFLPVAPDWDDLREMPRFRELLERCRFYDARPPDTLAEHGRAAPSA